MVKKKMPAGRQEGNSTDNTMGDCKSHKRHFKLMNSFNSFYNLEIKNLPALEFFFIKEWGETLLWSHDLSHHRRVWNYAKELLNYLEYPTDDSLFLEKLLIACYLHDIGMAIDTGTMHGHISLKLCERFLMENNLKKTDYTDLLEAVEKHDQKEYRNSFHKNRILHLLSIADDLDAFGYIGIYRYLEIYILRGTDPAELGQRILENAESRFKNFEKYFGINSDIVINHRKRFLVLTDFFNGYNIHIGNNSIDNIDQTGYPNIIRTVSENLKKGRKIHDLLHVVQKEVDDPFLIDFFRNLTSELN
jgi:HD superfamily phosphodiesterase